MFGGVAKTYCTWQMVGQPYEIDKKLYVKMLNPKTKNEKEVRFYTDKEHADLMPADNNNIKPLYHTFGFKDEQDWIWMIKDIDITNVSAYSCNTSNWRGCRLFGGSHYAIKNTIVPPVDMGKAFVCYWQDFKKEYDKN